MLFSVFDVLRFFEALQMLFYKVLLKWGKKWRKMLSPTYSFKFKDITLFLNWGVYFFSNVLFCRVVSTLRNIVKIDVENDNIVLTLSNVVQFNVEKHVVSPLFYVVNFNVASTLIWRCATSRRHINLKATLNRRWNVCWVLDCWIVLSKTSRLKDNN